MAKNTKQPNNATALAEEIRQLALSMCESVKGTASYAEAWGAVDRFYCDIDALRTRPKNAGSKYQTALKGDVPGHTKYLQGIDLPIYVNSIIDGNGLAPSEVSEMHVGDINGEECLLITPEIIG